MAEALVEATEEGHPVDVGLVDRLAFAAATAAAGMGLGWVGNSDLLGQSTQVVEAHRAYLESRDGKRIQPAVAVDHSHGRIERNSSGIEAASETGDVEGNLEVEMGVGYARPVEMAGPAEKNSMQVMPDSQNR